MLGLTDIMQRLPDSTWMGEPLVGGLALFPGSLGMRLLWELVCLPPLNQFATVINLR